ncbi:microcephalin-like [Penaeus chinensis]|uniref:microcephalin-like n=1 Tax=Penaeus chinensis TaxID=139456 RepID=UPI001FB61D87|nr:microcephalin-like [Penaeus chinensis]XP_047482110.1 microcephalin-like [Penaeus chinensis]
MKRGGAGSTRRSQDMHSVLFNKKSLTSADSVVVPETPTNLTCTRPSTALSTSMTSVMETPENEVGCGAQGLSHTQMKAQGGRSTGIEVPPDSSSDRDEINDSIVLDITPDLKLGKRRNLMSILESEDSFARSLKSQRTKNSSMLSGIQAAGQKQPEEDDLDLFVVSPVKKSKRRKSAAHVIMPFDLNDSESLSSKLRTIEEGQQRARRSVGGLGVEGPGSKKRRPAARAGRAAGRRKSLIVPLSADSSEEEEVIFNTQRKNSEPRGSYSKVGGTNRNAISKGTANNGINNNSQNAQNRSGDATKIFDSEDLDLTPIKTSSQETSIRNIIAGLDSQRTAMDETLPQALPVGCGVAGMSFQNFSTRSFRLLQAQLPGEAGGAGEGVKAAGGKGDTGGRHTDWMEPSEASESAATEPDVTIILRGVIAYVEVRMGSDNRSQVIKEQLKVLGAEVRDRLSPDTTHVIFKDGSKATFNRAQKRGLHLVSSLWLEACREKLQHVPESLYPSCSIDTYKTPFFLAKKLRKLKSMQPKEFSEEERIASERALRRIKAAEPSPEAKKNLNFFTPQAILPAIEENKDSPLFGISHLLTPKGQIRRNSGTTSDSETEEGDGVRGSPEKYMTPLVKRLYNRFISPKTDSAQRKRVPVGQASPLCSTEPKMRLKCSSEDSSDTEGEGSSEGGQGMQQEAVSKTTTVTAVRGMATEKDGTKNILEEEKDGSSESLVAEEGKDCSESLVAEEGKDCSGKRKRGRGRGEEPGESRHGEGEDLSESEGGLRAGNSSKGSESLALVLSDSSQDKSSGSEKTVQGRRRSSRCQRYGDSTEDSGSVKSFSAIKKSLSPGKGAIAHVNNFVSGNVKGSVLEGPAHGEANTEQEGSKRPGGKKSRRQSILKKGESVGKQGAKEKRKSVSYGGADILEVKEATDLLHIPMREKAVYEGPASALSSPSFGMTSSQLPTSQLRGHRLFNMDPVAPSQDLIVPSTPEDPKKFLRRPYTDLVIRGSRTQRTALKSQKGGSLSSMPLPRNPCGRRASGSSQVKQGTRGATTAPVRRSLRLSAAPFKTETHGDEVFMDSEEEFLGQSRIPLLPRPRRSTEEFQHTGRLKPKGKRGRQPKGDSLPSLYVSSVHSKEKTSLLPIIAQLGGFRVTSVIDGSTTHVVCGAARRTLSLLQGIARGAWVLDASWVYESLELGRWAPEEPFELFMAFPGAKISRLQREERGMKGNYTQTLFSGVGSIYVAEGCTPPSDQLRNLLELTGARLVSHSRSANLAIGPPPSSASAPTDSSVPRTLKVTHLSEKWALDSIQHHKIQDFAEYVLAEAEGGSAGSSASLGSISSEDAEGREAAEK